MWMSSHFTWKTFPSSINLLELRGDDSKTAQTQRRRLNLTCWRHGWAPSVSPLQPLCLCRWRRHLDPSESEAQIASWIPVRCLTREKHSRKKLSTYVSVIWTTSYTADTNWIPKCVLLYIFYFHCSFLLTHVQYKKTASFELFLLPLVEETRSPRIPALTKWTRLKYSSRSFWIGVPEMSTLLWALIRFKLWYVWLSEFFRRWPCSPITPVIFPILSSQKKIGGN